MQCECIRQNSCAVAKSTSIIIQIEQMLISKWRVVVGAPKKSKNTQPHAWQMPLLKESCIES